VVQEVGIDKIAGCRRSATSDLVSSNWSRTEGGLTFYFDNSNCSLAGIGKIILFGIAVKDNIVRNALHHLGRINAIGASVETFVEALTSSVRVADCFSRKTASSDWIVAC